MIQQAAYPSHEPDQVSTVPDLPGLGVAICLEELNEPDRGINGQNLPIEGFDGDTAANGEEESPETADSHLCERVLAAASQWFAMASCLLKDFVALIIVNEQQHRVCPDT